MKRHFWIGLWAFIVMTLFTGAVYGATITSAVYDKNQETVSVVFDNNYASGWMIDLCRSDHPADERGPYDDSVAQLYTERTNGLQAGIQVIDVAEMVANAGLDDNYYLYVSAYTPKEDTTIEEGDSGYQENSWLAEAGIGLAPTVLATSQAPDETVSVMNSGIPTLSIVLSDADAAKNNFDYLHANKGNKISARANLVDHSNPANNLSDQSAVVKGRGNFTWTLDKRPYQLKFDSKTSILGMEASKTWVLLANHTDYTFSRNKMIFDLADEMGLDYSSESRFVDLYINGEYLGNYLICEKVEVGSARVGLGNPDGIILEMDNHYGWAEPYYFVTRISKTIFALKDSVSKEEDPVTQQAFRDREADINKFESLLYADDPDWPAISAIIDVDSFVKSYFIAEFSKNIETGMSSIYFYQDGANDKLHAGPVWDYDLALGNIGPGDSTSDFAKNIDLHMEGEFVRNDWYLQLCRNEEFVIRANELYSQQIGGALVNTDSNLQRAIDLISSSAKQNFGKWPIFGLPVIENGRVSENSFAAEAAYLKSWMSQRVEYLNGAYGVDIPVLSYVTHVQNQGWQTPVTNGMIAGSQGQSLSLEALNVSRLNTDLAGTIEYSSHVQNIGWQDYVEAGLDSGTTGQALGIEAVRIRLTEKLAEDYDLYYQVNVKATDDVGITHVAFATWTEAGGQDDLTWQQVTLGDDNVYSATIKRSDHKNERGIYLTHVYAYDKAGNQVGPTALVINMGE